MMILRPTICFALATLATIASAQENPATQGQTRERDLVLAPAAESTPAPSASIPRGYALIVGVANYRNLDASRQLRFPETDAEAIHRVLISREGGAFPAENVHLLLGRQATLENIRRELEEWLPSVAQPADRVVVFFAGHGFVTRGQGYFAPWDVDPERLESTAYSMTTLGDVLANRVKAQWKVLLTDACHSGKINAETTNEALEQQFSSLPQNFLTLTATTEREQSYEDPALSTGFGLFTYFLAQAWNGHADNDPCDGRITADELIEYVRSNVRRYARDRQLSQTPTARGDYEPAMLLGVNSGCLAPANAAAPPPSMLGTAIVEVNMSDVDLFVDGDLVGRLAAGKPLVLPRLSSGLHEFKGVKDGYEPDRKQIMIAPGQDSAVTLRIRYARQRKPSAARLVDQGERLLFTQRSTVNPLNILPVARAQSDGDLRKARDLFAAALAEDPGDSKAAFNLGQANQLLADDEGSLQAYKRAIDLDPAYVDARAQYAAALIESGDPDQAIRELTEALRLDAQDDELYSMMARAYWDKGVWDRAADAAAHALRLKPSNAQAHLWRADALRQLASAERDPERRLHFYADARDGYRSFLNLTNFTSGFFERLAFHVVGHGVGSRRHADREGAYNSLRNAGFLGLCITEQRVGNILRAREYCQRALKYDDDDPITYFLLGNINRDLFNQRGSCDHLVAASRQYARMIALNPDLQESKNARNYLEQITGLLPKLRCRGVPGADH
jgi:tetratricopeptide (TPR) repeat protein